MKYLTFLQIKSLRIFVLLAIDTKGLKFIFQSQVIRHASYSSSTLDNDIALLKLATPITFANNKIAPVCLATPGNLYADVDATITGWGTLSSGKWL